MELLTSTLPEAIDKALQQGIQQLKQELLGHTKRMSDLENRMIEDEQPYLMTASQKLKKNTTKHLWIR